jgi:hypothetical protein
MGREISSRPQIGHQELSQMFQESKPELYYEADAIGKSCLSAVESRLCSL